MDQYSDQPAKVSEPLSRRQSGQNRFDGVVIIQFHLAENRDRFKRLFENPSQSDSRFQDSGYTSLASSLLNSPDSPKPESVLHEKSYHLRKREGSDANGSTVHHKRNNSVAQLDELILTGHPEARGCKGCFEFGARCSLLEPDSTYPCDMCLEDGCDCELLVAPKRKTACEQCKERHRIKCSYLLRDWGDHSKPCYHCASSKRRCMAGPAIDPLRRRLSTATCAANHTKSPEPQVPEPAQTRIAFSDVAKDQSTAARTDEKISAEVVSGVAISGASEAVSKLRADLKQQRSGSKLIMTKLAHPVTFGHNPPPNGTKPCQWCSEPFYGILGRDEKRVEVYEDYRGRYIEIAGGHIEDGCQPSRVCVYHTQEISRIVGCDLHELRKLTGSPPDSRRFEAAVARLMNSKDGKSLSKQDRWCSICPQLAIYECCKKQFRWPGTAQTRFGCGLQLCSICAVSLIQGYDNSLQRMLIDFDSKEVPKELYPFGLRADVSFLAKEGPLVKHILASIGQA